MNFSAPVRPQKTRNLLIRPFSENSDYKRHYKRTKHSSIKENTYRPEDQPFDAAPGNLERLAQGDFQHGTDDHCQNQRSHLKSKPPHDIAYQPKKSQDKEVHVT